MSMNQINALIREGVLQILYICGPILGAALIVGLIIAIFQATTSIQEQTLTFLPKFLTILLMIAFMSGFIFSLLSRYFERILAMIPNMAG